MKFGAWGFFSFDKPHMKMFRPSQMPEGAQGHEMMRLNAELTLKFESNYKLGFKDDTSDAEMNEVHFLKVEGLVK